MWYKHLIIKYYSRWNGAVPAETLGSAEGVGLESVSRGKSHDPECKQWPEQERLILVPIPLPPSFPDLDRAIQRSFGDLERPANLHNGMSSIVEILGNTQMSAGEDFGPAACPSSGAGCGQTNRRLSVPE